MLNQCLVRLLEIFHFYTILTTRVRSFDYDYLRERAGKPLSFHKMPIRDGSARDKNEAKSRSGS